MVSFFANRHSVLRYNLLMHICLKSKAEFIITEQQRKHLTYFLHLLGGGVRVFPISVSNIIDLFIAEEQWETKWFWLYFIQKM